MEIFITLAGVLAIVSRVIVFLVIAQFVLSLLISFNVVNMQNSFVSQIWKAINALLAPILRPIQRLMPNTGAIDFSPIVLIVGLNVAIWLLQRAGQGVLI